MVYVYSKLSKLNKYLDRKLTVEEIEESLIDMGLDLKGISNEDDPELKIELTAEKLDMISVVGIARAINYFRGFRTTVPRYELKRGEEEIRVEREVENIRPKTVAMIVRDFPMNDENLNEIIEIQEKIHQSFGRNRKKAAIGIYPIDKIKFPIKYTAKDPKEISFRPLDCEKSLNGYEVLEKSEIGKKYAHLLTGFDKFPVFIDANENILSMPPIINSYDTGRVQIENRDLFVEVSGKNLQHLDNILKVLATTFIEMGAKIESVRVRYFDETVYELDLTNLEDKFSLDYVNKLIGINIDRNELEKLLSKMMYGYLGSENLLEKVEIPVFRSDVWNDVDIADDIARAFGYNNIVPKVPKVSSDGEKKEFTRFLEKQVKLMTNASFLELYTYMLTSTKIHFDNMLIDEKKSDYIRLLDSQDQGLNMIRKIILPDNLNALLVNRKNKYPQKIFEIGFVIENDNTKDVLAKDSVHLTASIADPQSNYTQIKQVIDTFSKLNNIELEFREEEYSFLIKGRSASIYFKGEKIGFIGEIDPKVLVNFSLLVPVSSFEIDLEKLYSLLEKNN